MTLLTRIGRLFRADIHAVLDRIEEPDVLLKQALREMEAALDEDRRRLRGLELEQSRLAAREKDLRDHLPTIAEQLELCFTAAKPELARTLVRKRLEIEQSLKALAKHGAALAKEYQRLQDTIAERTRQLETIRQKAEALESGMAGHGVDPAATSVSEEDVEIAWLKERQLRGRP